MRGALGGKEKEVVQKVVGQESQVGGLVGADSDVGVGGKEGGVEGGGEGSDLKTPAATPNRKAPNTPLTATPDPVGRFAGRKAARGYSPPPKPR